MPLLLIRLTHHATRCSVSWWRFAGRVKTAIPENTLGIFSPGSQLRKRACTTCSSRDGQTGMRVPGAATTRRTSWSYDRSSNAGNAVTRSRLLRARCSIARDCPFGIGFRPPTWSPPTRQASLRCNCNGNSVSGATKQRGDSCRSCDEPWFDLSGTASPARWRSMRPMWVGSKSGAEGGRVRDSTKTIVVGAVEIRGQGIRSSPAQCHRGSVRRLAGRIPRTIRGSLQCRAYRRLGRLPPPRQQGL